LGGLSEEVKLEQAKLSPDSNYHSEENLRACEAHGVDAVIPDTRFRDPRFASQRRHQTGEHRKDLFGLKDFSYDAKTDCFLCPVGKRLRPEAATAINPRGSVYRRYRAERVDCAACPLRARCLPEAQHPQEPACSQGGPAPAADFKPEDAHKD
jgi:hypothetical protein